MPSSHKSIFFSHSSADKVLVDALADLLTTGCGVSPDDMLVTSLEGKGIPNGAKSFIEFLREQIQRPKLVLLVLSENYFASHFCLCELGTTWGMDLPVFALVVRPLKRSSLKATLAVTQAGNIDDPATLDELRDSIYTATDRSLATPTWSVKRDSFLRQIDAIIEGLPKPATVPRSDLQIAEQKYAEAVNEVTAKSTQIQRLSAQIEELRACKDKTAVAAIDRKYSSADSVFDKLRLAAKEALEQLKFATKVALYHSIRREPYNPNGSDAWDEVTDADGVRQVNIQTPSCWPNSEHPKVKRAAEALQAIQDFLKDPENDDFIIRRSLADEIVFDLSSKEFWRSYLVYV